MKALCAVNKARVAGVRVLISQAAHDQTKHTSLPQTSGSRMSHTLDFGAWAKDALRTLRNA